MMSHLKVHPLKIQELLLFLKFWYFMCICWVVFVHSCDTLQLHRFHLALTVCRHEDWHLMSRLGNLQSSGPWCLRPLWPWTIRPLLFLPSMITWGYRRAGWACCQSRLIRVASPLWCVQILVLHRTTSSLLRGYPR